MQSRINSQSGGTKQRTSFSSTYTLSFSDVRSMEALIMVTDGGLTGSSTFKVAIYRNGVLDQQYNDAVSCFTVNSVTLGSCPDGGSGEIVLTCNNWVMSCPIYYYKNSESIDTCPRPCDPGSLMNDIELYGGALSVDGVPAVQSVDGWEECCTMCADVPECRAWTFQPSSSVCGGPCCLLKGEGYSPMPSKAAVSGA
ncbi:peptidase C14 [Chlorella sorokiniana]|uniref:Peptidase C14 n=1 Tax=Chlorella sorokiniana TaxID=3076 RepID=A0A2P6TXZ7_CHLSO|nr:peptidase C14 [Chlorella sorokiniana]|eukprot:PRW58930.1 peptidase C14 [Chlorella sorokiniana]